MEAPYRLRLRSGGDEGPQAFLYAVDSSRFDGPVARFAVDATQQIPRIAPGGVVQVTGDVAGRNVEAVICPDGVTILPAGRVVGPEPTPLYAEPGLVHPGMGGSSASDLSASPDDWSKRLERAGRQARWGAAGGIALLCVCVMGITLLNEFSFRLLAWSGLAFGGAVASLVRVRGSRELHKRAEGARAAIAHPMVMRLWWAVGDGIDAQPVASLSHPGEEDEVDVILGAVPSVLDLVERVEVSVHGDPSPGGTAVIRYGDIELWPASTVLLVTGP